MVSKLNQYLYRKPLISFAPSQSLKCIENIMMFQTTIFLSSIFAVTFSASKFFDLSSESLFRQCLIPHDDTQSPVVQNVLIILPDSTNKAQNEPVINDIIKTLYKTGRKLLIFNPTASAFDRLLQIWYGHQIKSYIIIFQEPHELLDILRMLHKINALNALSYYIFISIASDLLDEDMTEEVFRPLFDFSIVKAVLLIMKDQQGFNLYRFTFFRNYGCATRHTKNSMLIDVCTNGTLSNNTPWFRTKLPKIFKTCTITVVYLNIPPYVINLKNGSVLSPNEFALHGLEVGVLSNVFDIMNVSVTFMEINKLGDVYSNRTASGSLKYVLGKQAEVAIGGYSPNEHRCNYLDCSYPYYFESLSWAVPHEHLDIVELERIINIVTYKVWILIFIFVGIATWMVTFISKRNKKEFQKYRKPDRSFEDIFLIIVTNVTVASLPRSLGVRTVFFLTLCFASIFNAAFTTYLTSNITNSKGYNENYNDISDILKRNLKVYISPNSQRFFQDQTSVNYRLIRKSLDCPVKQYKQCLDEVALNKNASFLGPKGFLNYASNYYLSTSLTHLLKVFPPEVNYPLNFLMRKGFWGYERVNEILLQASATGFTDKWLKYKDNRSATIVEGTENMEESDNLGEVRVLIVVLLGGYLIASIVFVVEIIFSKM